MVEGERWHFKPAVPQPTRDLRRTVTSDVFSLAQILGYGAFVLGVVCFAQTDDRRFKLFMAAEVRGLHQPLCAALEPSPRP